MNGQPCHVCRGSGGQVVSSRDPVHVSSTEPPPSNTIKLKRKKMKRPILPELGSSAIRFEMLI